jgi:acylphosphatase
MNAIARSSRVVISGRVQGVGFRAWVEYTALLHGLQGWVRNRRNGSVEALFVGPPEDVRAMIDMCRHGPSGARVDAVNEEPALPQEIERRYRGESFSVLPTE